MGVLEFLMQKTIKTKDSYEATFYIMWGGRLENVRKLVLNKHTANKRGFIDQWTITVSNVADWAIDTWRTRNAFGNITKFVDVRKKLKRDIKRELAS